jgi:Dual specificity phosphatase, catalytic domain
VSSSSSVILQGQAVLMIPRVSGMNEVFPDVFVGSYHPAKDKKQLKSAGITHIISCVGLVAFPEDFKYLSFFVSDTPTESILKYLKPCIAFIEDCLSTQGRCLIHCGAGISRSGAVAVSFVMHRNNLTFREALKIVLQGRSVIRPNPGFEKQLKKFEQQIKVS